MSAQLAGPRDVELFVAIFLPLSHRVSAVLLKTPLSDHEGSQGARAAQVY